jgi:hypothetical protein
MKGHLKIKIPCVQSTKIMTMRTYKIKLIYKLDRSLHGSVLHFFPYLLVSLSLSQLFKELTPCVISSRDFYFLLCCLFNDAISYSAYTAPSGTISYE